MERWSKEKAWEWYNARPWIRGFNGYPSNCVNRVAIWQSYKHEEVFNQCGNKFKEFKMSVSNLLLRIRRE